MSIAAMPVADRWKAHFRRHGPTDRGVLALMLALAEYADEQGRTGIAGAAEDGGDLPIRFAPCRDCGLGLDA